jgi:hypothetical protein
MYSPQIIKCWSTVCENSFWHTKAMAWAKPSRSQAVSGSFGLAWGLRKPKLSQARPKLGLSGQARPEQHYRHTRCTHGQQHNHVIIFQSENEIPYKVARPYDFSFFNLSPVLPPTDHSESICDADLCNTCKASSSSSYMAWFSSDFRCFYSTN